MAAVKEECRLAVSSVVLVPDTRLSSWQLCPTDWTRWKDSTHHAVTGVAEKTKLWGFFFFFFVGRQCQITVLLADRVHCLR